MHRRKLRAMLSSLCRRAAGWWNNNLISLTPRFRCPSLRTGAKSWSRCHHPAYLLRSRVGSCSQFCLLAFQNWPNASFPGSCSRAIAIWAEEPVVSSFLFATIVRLVGRHGAFTGFARLPCPVEGRHFRGLVSLVLVNVFDRSLTDISAFRT